VSSLYRDQGVKHHPRPHSNGCSAGQGGTPCFASRPVASVELAPGPGRADQDAGATVAGRQPTALAVGLGGAAPGRRDRRQPPGAAGSRADQMRSAQEAADRLGEDRDDFGTEFGPTNVALHAVAVAVELGDAGTAFRRAASVDASGPSTERRARFLVDVARAHHQRRQGRELLQRLEGEVDEVASLMLATADRLSNQRQRGRCEQRSNRRRCPRCRGGARDFTRRLDPGDRAHLPAAPGRRPVPAAVTDPRPGHGRAGHLRPGRKESMISRAPVIAHTGPQGNRHLSRLAELGPAARR
jgi:hypothetical protein